MKRALTTTLALLAMAGCGSNHSLRSLDKHHDKNPYEGRIFYSKYLNPQTSALDARIQSDLDQLRANPDLATVHNDLGMALLQKGFPKDAEVEFERAVANDKTFYPAWYNLGLVRQSRGETQGAQKAYERTVEYRPGHALALFQLGLMAEQNGNSGAAINYYAKAFLINHQLLDVRTNPRILDSKLVDLALIQAYPDQHARESMQFQGAPTGYVDNPITTPPPQPAAASPQAAPNQIVTPAAPVTDPGKQKAPPKP
jgi:tetratricopeptide (TPR) repeat protein